MPDTTAHSETRLSTAAPNWASELLPVAFRAVAAVLLLPSAAVKFVDYSGQTAVFADIGVPAPGITVLVVALLELVAGVLILTGIEGRAGALVTAGIMAVAIALVGLELSNIAVLVSCLGILGLGTGRYTVGEAKRDSLGQIGDRLV